jgi:hypothetical protein
MKKGSAVSNIIWCYALCYCSKQRVGTKEKQILNSTIEQWMAEGNEKQIDDILVMGVRV